MLDKPEASVITPLKGLTPYGWHFEQNVVSPKGKTYALKASEGSGNRIKVIIFQYETADSISGTEERH